jgi:MSHA biogenesis protein MshP
MMKRKAFYEHGFGVISAIFLLVVLAGLGAAMVNISVMQHIGSSMDVQGTRAYQAARAGIEWGLYQSLIANPSTCPASPTSFAPPAPTLRSFTVTVTCTSTTNTDANPPITVRQLKSTACNVPDAGACPGPGGTTDYVQRVVQATF